MLYDGWRTASSIWLCCALMIIGALAACSGQATPLQPLPTLTLVPSTATPTATPITPTPTVPDLPAADEIFPTPTAAPIYPILESDIPPDAGLTRRIVRDLANERNLPPERIQLVQIEAAQWFDVPLLGCGQTDMLTMDDAPDVDLVEGFRYTMLVGNVRYEYRTVGTLRFVRCQVTARISDELLLAVDPIADDMLSLVQRRVAAQLDLSSRRVELVSIVAYEWSDTSLGCPRPDQTYNEAAIDGYRIEVQAGDQTYIYHTDSVQAILCDPQYERLPR